MSTRSRGGCVDCKRSKVKCDEVHPSCGTCARRRITCHGYNNVKEKLKQARSRRASSPYKKSQERTTTSSDNGPKIEKLGSPTSPSLSNYGSVFSAQSPHSQKGDDEKVEPSQMVLSTRGNRHTTPSDLNEFFSMVPLSTVSTIPPGMINPADEPTIEVYFSRHPTELVIGREFTNEMNANVLMVLQRNPKAISDCLFAVGRIYVSDGGFNFVVPVLDRRARILANLRAMDDPDRDLEQIVVMLLGLCAMELIDMKAPAGETAIPALLQNAALLISHHIQTGREVTSLAKYFIRALARQDMITSLTHFRRPAISTTVWLDEQCRHTPDRFMGYTATLMPLLAELCALAEDVRGPVYASCIAELEDVGEHMASPLPQGVSLSHRAAHLAARISAWQPFSPRGVTFRSSRKFLSQAFCYRTAALLYLHRLFNPPGTSTTADDTALDMAHNVMIYTIGPPEELRMSLWPVFIAACELVNRDDRAIALEAFGAVCTFRRTATALRTRKFCVDRVWKGRDEGSEWNWMALVAQHPGELIPI